jgi:hypothetical protein
MPELSLNQAYATLGLEPDCPWDDVRRQHKRLAFAWHPDRHAATPNAKIALERAKEINAAYDRLSAHYRDQMQRDVIAVNNQPEADASHTNASLSDERRHARPYVLAAVAACAGVFWLLTRLAVSYEDGDRNAADPGFASRESMTPVQELSDASRRTPDSSVLPIEVGMSTELVIKRAGLPSRKEGDIWHYGDTQVYFRHGVVTHLRGAGEFDLADTPVARSNPERFTYGSSMDTVRRIQGTPAAEGDTQWTYGPSKIYFRNGYVSGWYDSPLQPLKIENP